MSNGIFDKTLGALHTDLQMRMLKHNITSSNIANAETPGFHAKKLDFEEALARALDIDETKNLSTSDENHFSVGGGAAAVRPDIYDNPDGAVNPDGNTVDLEKEMSNLSENTIQYKAAMQLINKKLAALRYAIGEGR